jgi:flagellar hook assembly protein FlgD
VRLAIYRVDGRLVRTLMEESLPQGQHQWTWDGTDGRGEAVGSGSYIARLETGDGATSNVALSLVR